MLPTNRLRILVADDDRAILDLYQRVLSSVREEDATLFADLDALAGSLFGGPDADPQPATPAAPAASYELVQCRQGDDAVDMVTRALEVQRPFAVAFLDVRMPPGPDGIWAAERIRALDPHIELVMVTGYSNLHPEDIARRVPPVHKLLYIQKPFHPQEITQFAAALGTKWQTEWELRQAHNDLTTTSGMLAALEQSQKALLTAHVELKEKNAQLAELNASKDKLFSIISHDLRSPFSIILGYAKLIAENFDRYRNDEIKTYAEKLQTSAEKLQALLENLLTWSQIQQGAMECCPENVDISDVVEENMDLFFSAAAQKQITLRNLVETAMYAYADYNMLNTVLRNLVSNALKFTPPDGLIEISARSNKRHVEVAVSDTGTGISKEDIPQLFRIDVQYTNVGTAGEKGTGLGLSLCKDLVEKNGGTIWVESELGAGTTFRFTLPHEHATAKNF